MIFFSACKNLFLGRSGFTFIEIVISVAIASTLIGFIILNLLNIHQVKTVQSASEILISDLRSQQTKAMSLSIQNTSDPDDYGVFFSNNRYFLFKGNSYDPASSSNMQVNLPDNFSFTNVTLPNSQVVFLRGSGQVQNFTSGQNTITIHDSSEQNSRMLEINYYGVINYN
jgi:prepilin-type N-terminal cleavage/methylation domain-containing protein